MHLEGAIHWAFIYCLKFFKIEMNFANNYQEILRGLFAKYEINFKNELIGIIASGGIDSSIIVSYVLKYFSDAKILSMTSEKSMDEPFVKKLGQHFKKKIDWIEIDNQKVMEVNSEVINLLVKAKVQVNEMQIALGTGFYLLCQHANELGIKYLFTGQGPDILLAGYHKYKQLIINSKQETGNKKSVFSRVIVTKQDSINKIKTIKEQIREDLPLLEVDKRRDGEMANKWGVKLINPYLEKEFVEFSLTIPEDLLIHDNVEKYISRLVAKELNLPEEIVWRPKKAFQYSTGIQKLLS